MLREYTASAARIPVVRMIGGSHRWPQTRKYETVAHAIVDERDVEYLSQFVWTLARDNKSKTDYVNRNLWIDGKTVKIQIHREIWERHNGPVPEGYTVDHKDRDGLHNRLDNLRLADRIQQQANQSLYKNSKTGYKGVCWVPKPAKFQVGIRHAAKSLHFGWYETAEEAAFVYNFVARTIHGEYAWLNPIPDGVLTDERKAELISIVEDQFFPRHGLA